MLTFHAIGDWPEGQLVQHWIRSTRPLIPEVEQLIETAWNEVLARPGVNLFDGPMCRLESWGAHSDRLELVLSDTSYKAFMGTNLSHPDLGDRYDQAVLANPVGVSPSLTTADGWLMMGRRNGSVAYYPNRVHPFAGALEPRDRHDVFGAVRRELFEELHFTADDIAEIRCTGIAEDRSIRQPELIFRAISTRTRAEIESMFDRTEHNATWAVLAEAKKVDAILNAPAELTPVAVAALLLCGRVTFGDAWFAEHAAHFSASPSPD